MKKILFIIRDFKQGGIPRCLQSLLPMFDNSKYEIDLFCCHHDGPYRGQIENCSVLPQNRILYHLLSFGVGVTPIKRPWTFVVKFADKIMNHLTRKSLLERTIALMGDELSNKYDVVIAYSEGIAAQIASVVSCEKRFVYIHNDYSFDCARGDSGTSFEIFNKIVCVSEATRKSFINVFPNLKDKTRTIYNIINDRLIKQLSNEAIPAEYDKNCINILSVGRVCYQKRFEVIPSIIKTLSKARDKEIRWYIVGDGPENEVEALRREIKRLDVTMNCIILGSRDNPYPYIRYADLFVLTSRYESYPTVINEALALGTTVISVDIPPAYEMLPKESILALDSLADGIAHFLREKRQKRDNMIDISKHNATVMLNLEKLIAE